MLQHDIVIVGGGPAGMAAAVKAYDSGVRDVVIIDREETPGGILRQCIHNGFGLHKLGRELTGPEYAAVYAEMVKERGIRVYTETTVTAVTADRTVTAQSRDGMLKIHAGAVVLAMGCRERSRGALNIAGTRPAGVYSAGTAQKLMNCEGFSVGRRAVILGSGDIGLIMARRMSLEGAKVEAVCELMPYSGGLARNIEQCLHDFDIPLCLSHTVAEIHGDERLTGVTVAAVDEHRRIIDSTRRFIPCDTLLLSVGLIPENELTRAAGIPIDPVTNGAVVDEHRQTAIPGIFACGNVLHVHDLVDHVSNESFKAGHAAAAYARAQKNTAPVAQVKDGDGVRGVVPQRVHLSGEASQSVDLMFRPSGVFKNATVVVRSGDKEIARKKSPIFTPGEMVVVTLKPEVVAALDGSDITVTMERN